MGRVIRTLSPAGVYVLDQVFPLSARHPLRDAHRSGEPLADSTTKSTTAKPATSSARARAGRIGSSGSAIDHHQRHALPLQLPKLFRVRRQAADRSAGHNGRTLRGDA